MSVATLRTGKLAPRKHPNTLLLNDYAHPQPPAPERFSIPGADKQSWPMYGNDQVGDCTEAGLGHLMQAQAASLGGSLIFPDAAILKAYSDVSGYNPTTGANDNGAVETDVLAQWQGAGVDGHKILGWAAINHTNHAHVAAACYWLVGLYIGLALPITAQAQIRGRQPWTVGHNSGPDAYPGSWGGHAVDVIAYDPDGLTCVTWGRVQRLTWEFWDRYVDESYGVVGDAILDPATGKDYAGLNVAQLLADAHAIAGR